MTEPNLTMDVRDAAGGIRVIDIRGEITAFSEEVMSSAHTKASESNPSVVMLNFEGLDYMNSGGIGLLVTTLIRANRLGQKLVAYGLNDHYQEIFSLTRLDEAIEIYDDETAAFTAA